MQIIQEINPHLGIAPCVNMWSVFFFFFFYHFLDVGACVYHIAHGKPSGARLYRWHENEIQIVLTPPLCYSIMSHATLIL